MKRAVTIMAVLFLVSLVPLVFGDVGEAHSIATKHIVSHTDRITDDPDVIPIVFSAVDGNTLVIGIDADVLASNVTYTESQVQEFLGIMVPVDIKYLKFTTGSVDDNSDPFADNCYPVRPGFGEWCEDHFEEQIGVDPCTDSPNSLACYFYPRYIDQCLPVHTHSSCSTYETIITNAGYAEVNNVGGTVSGPTIFTNPEVFANADDAECDITLYRSSNGEPICVSESSVTPLVESGQASLGTGWKDVCLPRITDYDWSLNQYKNSTSDKFNLDVFLSCRLNASDLDACWASYAPPQCLDYDIRPMTASECMKKYRYGYMHDYISHGHLPTTWSGPMAYSADKCELYDWAYEHGEACQQWWLRAQELDRVTNATLPLEEELLIQSACLLEREPDWSWWGCLDIGDEENRYCGSMQHHIVALGTHNILDDCIENDCTFRHHDSKVTDFRCAKNESYDYRLHDFQLQKNPDTEKYECKQISIELLDRTVCDPPGSSECEFASIWPPYQTWSVGHSWTGHVG